ncbi:MAG: chemotaxis protein CheW [Herbaspirillum sp.]
MAHEQSKNGHLHAFQAELLDHIESAQAGPDRHNSRLGVVVGGHRCLIDLREASGIIDLIPINRVPLTRDWYLGLANVDGNLIGVIDLARFCGGEQQVRGKDSRVIVTSSVVPVACGFLVSRVLGLRHTQEMVLQENADGAAMLIAARRYLDRSRQEWAELSLAAIVDDTRFLQVGL